MSIQQLNIGVIGVGSMGQHHARVYNELPEANLVGVFDVDREAAEAVAKDYSTRFLEKDALLEQVDAVSLAVPTQYHFDEAVACIDAGVAFLIEKPVVEDPDRGYELARRAAASDVPVQVGHIERFNPAVQTAQDVVQDLNVLGVKAERLGPPPNRHIEDSAVIDLMIHDIDIVLSLIGETPVEVASAGVHENRHASALLEFDVGIVASKCNCNLSRSDVRTVYWW